MGDLKRGIHFTKRLILILRWVAKFLIMELSQKFLRKINWDLLRTTINLCQELQGE